MIALKLLRSSGGSYTNILKVQRLGNIPNLNRLNRCRTIYESAIERNAGNKTMSRLKQKDGMPHESELIYRAEYDRYYQGSYICVLFTSVAFPAWLILMGYKSDFRLPIQISEEFELHSILEISLFVSMISILGVASAITLKRYPLRIYHHPGSNTYTAVYKNAALQTVLKQFQRGEVQAIPEEKMLPTQISRFRIKGGKTILNEGKFRKPSDMLYMMGYRVNKDDPDVHEDEDNMH